MKERLLLFSVNHPKSVILSCALLVVILGFFIPGIKVDTDPENMLSDKEFVRVFHNQEKKEFDLYDFIVLGIVNEENPNGIFNVDSLRKIYEITGRVKQIKGVVAYNIISPSTTDNIIQDGIGTVRFEWLMSKPPENEAEALRIRDEAKDNPMLDGTLVSEDGKALCLYIPIERKDMSYRISKEIQSIIKDYKGAEKYHITGLPVAEDTFGFEMFKQMGISAPFAGLIIFIIMWFSFRKVSIVAIPMIVAVMVVIATMGLLIACGFTVHIMSSMIPIFLMPISVLDSVHIISQFYDNYPRFKDKRETTLFVMNDLFTPMLYTSLTTIAGFMSLATTPIPPVQVFGLFVGFGVVLAWVLTVTFIPACTVLLSEKTLSGFGIKDEEKTSGIIVKLLNLLSDISVTRYKLVLVLSTIIIIFSVLGLFRIVINDNPVRWFTSKHPIRVADEVLNSHFGGTYTAYLILSSKDKNGEVFKQPAMLRYISAFQKNILEKGNVGKSTSVSDVVKKVYCELMEGDKNYFRIPDTPQAVAQCLISYENSHKPDDLWHLVTPDFSKANVWVQLKTGDNQNMDEVVKQVDNYFKKNPPPFDIDHNWAGLTYINTVWQDKMVGGMLRSLLGSFVIVLLMMVFLFRSLLWGIISMLPLSITITMIYGIIGWVGKDYDMPVAVLSSLTLGLSVDYAIHFLERARVVHAEKLDWKSTVTELFGSSGRAIYRNAIVIAIGFIPLMFAPLVPYKTVGFFMMSIMFISSGVTLLLLPSIGTLFYKKMFVKEEKGLLCKWCNCFILFLVAVFGLGYTAFSWNPIKFVSVIILIAIAVGCRFFKTRKSCNAKSQDMQ